MRCEVGTTVGGELVYRHSMNEIKPAFGERAHARTAARRRLILLMRSSTCMRVPLACPLRPARACFLLVNMPADAASTKHLHHAGGAKGPPPRPWERQAPRLPLAVGRNDIEEVEHLVRVHHTHLRLRPTQCPTRHHMPAHTPGNANPTSLHLGASEKSRDTGAVAGAA